MEVTCPHCAESFSLAEDKHYKMVTCDGCGKSFPALSEDTQKISRDFLDEILGGKPKE